MVEDLGGAIQAARVAETYRTAPYRWIRNDSVSLKTLEKIKSNSSIPIDIDSYFEEMQ
jgi:hypothetical protein